MPPAQRSVGRFCSMVTKDLTSLGDIDAADLGQGAQVFVLSNQKSYRLGPGGISPLPPVTLTALGGVGTWIQENAVNDQTFFIELNSAGFIGSGIVVNTWHAMPSGAAFYSQGSAKACWTLDSTTGIVTYSGPDANFVVTGNMFLSSINDGNVYEFTVSRNGTIIGTTAILADVSRSSLVNSGIFLSNTSGIYALTAGTTFQHAFRNTSAGVAVNVQKYQALFQLLPG